MYVCVHLSSQGIYTYSLLNQWLLFGSALPPVNSPHAIEKSSLSHFAAVVHLSLLLHSQWLTFLSPIRRSQANHRGFGQDKAKRVSSVKRKGLPPEGVSLKVRCQTSAGAGRACDSGMANKENELASEDMWGVHYNDKCGHPLTSGEGSKMAGVGSKCSDAVAEVRTHTCLCTPRNRQRVVVCFL